MNTSQTDKIERVIELKAPIEKVWRALTDHTQFGMWFRVKLDAPFMVGQRSIGHITACGHEHVKWDATINRMDAPSYFSYTWHPYNIDPNTDYSKEPPTLVEFKLEARGAGTRLTVTESGFDAIPAGRRMEAFRANSGGWAAQLNNIKTFVET